MSVKFNKPIQYITTSDNEFSVLCKDKTLITFNEKYSQSSENNIAGILGGRSGSNSTYDVLLSDDGFTIPIHNAIVDTQEIENEDGTITTNNISNLNWICAQQVFNCNQSSNEVYFDPTASVLTTTANENTIPLYCFSTAFYGCVLALAKTGDIYVAGWHQTEYGHLGKISNAVRCVVTNDYMHVNNRYCHAYIITLDNKCYSIYIPYYSYYDNTQDLTDTSKFFLDIRGETINVIDVVYNMNDNILGGKGLLVLKTDHCVYNCDPYTLQVREKVAENVAMLSRQVRHWNGTIKNDGSDGFPATYISGYITLDNKFIWNRYNGRYSIKDDKGNVIEYVNNSNNPNNFKEWNNDIEFKATSSILNEFLIINDDVTGQYNPTKTGVFFNYRIRFYEGLTSNVVNYVTNS